MKCQATFCCLLLLLVTAISLAADESQESLRVGSRTCLFLDDHFIAEQAGLKRTWHQGRPHSQAIVAETEPSDHWILMHGSCFYDPTSKVRVSLPMEHMTETGALGRPDLATPEKGQRLLDTISARVVEFVREFATWPLPQKGQP